MANYKFILTPKVRLRYRSFGRRKARSGLCIERNVAVYRLPAGQASTEGVLFCTISSASSFSGKDIATDNATPSPESPTSFSSYYVRRNDFYKKKNNNKNILRADMVRRGVEFIMKFNPIGDLRLF